MSAWADPEEVACVVPNGPMPVTINGLAASTWSDRPHSPVEWEALAASQSINEPPFEAPANYKRAAGVVTREPDGRVWLVAPSNAFGGYQATFPKGTLDGKSSQATALVETFEECGLHVRLVRHLIDTKRSVSYTRYYLAERLGGNPADMGWESQAVILAPASRLKALLNNPNDLPILQALSPNGA
ncbi:NUDIX domain-containing protein [Hydrogenophaga sp.]|uniref:NUDIX domain-containing protein n=1 Tax=Hydrogenophaga sp. TaxID=1904254 RepID=UPI0025C29202|nr:NUDIX domain-containing protein [Hydrogenophaga sp.]